MAAWWKRHDRSPQPSAVEPTYPTPPRSRLPQAADQAEQQRFDARLRSLLEGRVLRSVAYRQLKWLEDREFWVRDGWHLSVSGVHLSTDRGEVYVTWGWNYTQYAVEVVEESPFSTDPEGDPGPGGPDTGDGWDDLIGTVITGVTTCWLAVEPDHQPAAPAAIRLDFDGGRMLWLVAATEIGDQADILLFADEIAVVFTPDVMRRFGFTDKDLGIG